MTGYSAAGLGFGGGMGLGWEGKGLQSIQQGWVWEWELWFSQHGYYSAQYLRVRDIQQNWDMGEGRNQQWSCGGMGAGVHRRLGCEGTGM